MRTGQHSISEASVPHKFEVFLLHRIKSGSVVVYFISVQIANARELNQIRAEYILAVGHRGGS
jgi:hypothetical protein